MLFVQLHQLQAAFTASSAHEKRCVSAIATEACLNGSPGFPSLFWMALAETRYFFIPVPQELAQGDKTIYSLSMKLDGIQVSGEPLETDLQMTSSC